MTGHLDQHGFKIIYDLTIFILKQKRLKNQGSLYHWSHQICESGETLRLQGEMNVWHPCGLTNIGRNTVRVGCSWLGSWWSWNPWWFGLPQNGVFFLHVLQQPPDPNHVNEFRMDFFFWKYRLLKEQKLVKMKGVKGDVQKISDFLCRVVTNF